MGVAYPVCPHSPSLHGYCSLPVLYMGVAYPVCLHSPSLHGYCSLPVPYMGVACPVCLHSPSLHGYCSLPVLYMGVAYPVCPHSPQWHTLSQGACPTPAACRPSRSGNKCRLIGKLTHYKLNCVEEIMCSKYTYLYFISFLHTADSRFAPGQWETLKSNAVSHWLGTNLESSLLHNEIMQIFEILHDGIQGYKEQVLELMQMHPKQRLRRVILIASRYSTGLKLENYYFFTFTFSWPEVGKLFHIYFFFTFSFSWPEVGKLFHIYFFTFSQTEVGKLFRSYVFTFSRPEVGKLFHISMAKCKTAVTPLLIHWSYCSLALSHQNME